MRSVHLVGSSPYDSAAESFKQFGKYLSGCCTRFPDGETGARTSWITWQDSILRDHPQFELIDTIIDPRDPTRPFRKFRLKPGVTPNQVTFGPLGYSRVAAESYSDFLRAQAAGQLPKDSRFLVALPTPLCFVQVFLPDPALQVDIEPVYRKAMIAEVLEIAKVVPLSQLAIQWDIAAETIRLEKQSIAARTDAELAQAKVDFGTFILLTSLLCDAVPGEADLIIHLCYGDFGHRHTIEPPSLALCTRIANGLTDAVKRPIQLFHFPVPKDRDDAPFFEPLAALRLRKGSTLCLGLVHATDGLEGAKRRMKTASSFSPAFDVATECGFGRRPKASMGSLLTLHAELAKL